MLSALKVCTKSFKIENIKNMIVYVIIKKLYGFIFNLLANVF